MRRACGVAAAITLLLALAAPRAFAADLVRFAVYDPATARPVPAARLVLVDGAGRTTTLFAGAAVRPVDVDLDTMRVAAAVSGARVVRIPCGAATAVARQAEPPVRDIYIKVTATRVAPPKAGASGTVLNSTQLNTFTSKVGGSTSSLTTGQSGVTSDSGGQQHIRGEHTDISYVMDGIPLPDTLSGRQGSVIAPSAIDTLQIITGGFAPEYGGSTAAVLDFSTTPAARRQRTDLAVQAGTYGTLNSDVTAEGPLGSRGGYVLDLRGNRTDLAEEPQQPDIETAHNAGSYINGFLKVNLAPGKRDDVTFTAGYSPATQQLSNRTGLPGQFTALGQGFGFLGLRNADGTRPDVTAANAGALGAAPMNLRSQQDDGMDITQREVNEFGAINWRHRAGRNTLELAATLLHSGQDVANASPGVDILSLPVDNSIEYNPTAHRNVHHVQFSGNYDAPGRAHDLKAGFLADDQNGDESYSITPASRLALDAVAALDPALAPAGAVMTGGGGAPVLDVDGNPVYVPSSGIAPTLHVHRAGFYRAAFVQDTWRDRRFTANYGFRFDWYRQTESLGGQVVEETALSPRFNFTYALSGRTMLNWSYDRLFNIPPLAQGAIVGQAIVPEVLDQYDVGVQHRLASNQSVSFAYYVKNIRHQVDVGLLVPGSEIGLFSGVTFADGGVHGIEASYDVTPRRGRGLDAYVNYTYSLAKPNGLDNTGASVPDYNDHDQRQTVGIGAAWLWSHGMTAALTVNHGSGLASSPYTLNARRVPRTEVDFRFASGQRWFGGHIGLGLDVLNVLDSRTVINYQSAFTGTRFQSARTILFTVNGSF